MLDDDVSGISALPEPAEDLRHADAAAARGSGIDLRQVGADLVSVAGEEGSVRAVLQMHRHDPVREPLEGQKLVLAVHAEVAGVEGAAEFRDGVQKIREPRDGVEGREHPVIVLHQDRHALLRAVPRRAAHALGHAAHRLFGVPRGEEAGDQEHVPGAEGKGEVDDLSVPFRPGIPCEIAHGVEPLDPDPGLFQDRPEKPRVLFPGFRRQAEEREPLFPQTGESFFQRDAGGANAFDDVFVECRDLHGFPFPAGSGGTILPSRS